MSTSPKKVLILEDEPALNKVVSNKLRASGYEVLSLTDGTDAISFIKKKKPDLILLDLVMPKIDGFTVLKELKDDPELKDIVVIVLSNLSQDTDVDSVLALGAKEFLVKSDTPLSIVLEMVDKYIKN